MATALNKKLIFFLIVLSVFLFSGCKEAVSDVPYTKGPDSPPSASTPTVPLPDAVTETDSNTYTLPKN